MSQPEPTYEVNKKFTQFLVRFAAIEALLFAGILLAMTMDIITAHQMLVAILVVALLGGGIMVRRVLLLQRVRAEKDNSDAAVVPVNTLNDSSAANKFGDPNE